MLRLLACSLLVLSALFGTFIGRSSAQQIAITFDDLPVHGPLPPGETRLEVAQQLLSAIQAAHLPPIYGMVNGIWTQREPNTIDVLKLWHADGEPLASHTWSHMGLNTNTAEAWEADVLRNEPLLESITSIPPAQKLPWRYLRYPYLQEGETPAKRIAVAGWLKDHGYRIAEITASFGDYNWNEPYARCAAKHDTAALQRLHDTYLAAAHQNIAADAAQARAVFGHDIPLVLLLHIGAFDARIFPELVAQLRADGYTFVSLEEAEKDPAYTNPSNQFSGGGTLQDMIGRTRNIPAAHHDDYTAELHAICR